MKVQIKRVCTNEHGTFGVLVIDDIPQCVTLEDIENNNQPDSCIPEGIYDVESYNGTKFKDVFILKNVPNRSAILIHWGNTKKDTSGCILLGMYYVDFGGKVGYGIAASRPTFIGMKKKLPDKFTIEITKNY